MRKLYGLFFFLALCGQGLWALPLIQSAPGINGSGMEFVAPLVASESDVPLRAGLIFYDIGSGLKIVNPTGNIDLITTEGANNVSSTGSNEIIVRGRIELASGTPVVMGQSGIWIDNVTLNATGDITVDFTPGVFGTAPTCVCSVEAANAPRMCQMNATTSASAARFLIMDASATGYNLRINIICMSSAP